MAAAEKRPAGAQIHRSRLLRGAAWCSKSEDMKLSLEMMESLISSIFCAEMIEMIDMMKLIEMISGNHWISTNHELCKEKPDR